MNDNCSTHSEFRPITPPLHDGGIPFGPLPPTYESHFTETLSSSSQNSTEPRTRSRKSSNVSTTSTRSTMSRGTSTWKPGTPFLSSGLDGRAVVSTVPINASGSISVTHVRSKTTSAVPSPLNLAPPSPTASATSIPLTPHSSPTSNLRLSPSISRLRTIANNARRRESLSSSIPSPSSTTPPVNQTPTPEDKGQRSSTLIHPTDERMGLNPKSTHKHPFQSRIPTPSFTSRQRTTLKSPAVTLTTSISGMGEIGRGVSGHTPTDTEPSALLRGWRKEDKGKGKGKERDGEANPSPIFAGIDPCTPFEDKEMNTTTIPVKPLEPPKKDWFSSLSRSKGKALAIVQGESLDTSGEGEQRDVRAMLGDVDDDIKGDIEFIFASGEGEAQAMLGDIHAANEFTFASSSASLPLPHESPLSTFTLLTTQSTPSLPIDESTPFSTSPPLSPHRSSPRTIFLSQSTPHTPQRKSRSWFSSPLSGSPLGVSVFTASRGKEDVDVDESTQPPGYIPPPPVGDHHDPPSYTHPPPPPSADENPTTTSPRRSDSLPSLDSVVPSLPTTPPGVTSSHGLSVEGGGGAPLMQRKSSNASLNASSGRFLLSFGLHGILGRGKEREKVPSRAAEREGGTVEGRLEQVKVDDKVNGEEWGVAMERSESEETAVHASSVDDEDSSTTIRGRPERSGKERVVEGSQGVEKSTRWWGMVGWVSAGGEEVAKEVKDVNGDLQVEEEVLPVDVDEEASIGQEAQNTEQGTEDIVGSVAWFARWTWYGGGEISSTHQETTKLEDGKQESEQPLSESSSPTFDANPLSRTISTSAERSIWSTLFNSTYATTVGNRKAIEGAIERDEHGTEVMDIESDDQVPPPQEDTTLALPEPASRGWAGPMRMMVAAVSSSTLRDVSVERRQTRTSGPINATSQNGNHPDITGSSSTTTTTKNMPGDAKDGVNGGGYKSVLGRGRDETTTLTSLGKRTAPSPAPSTSSSSNGASSKPNGPPPPNLLLPTWEDTFFVPPRNHIEPPPTPHSHSHSHSTHPPDENMGSKGLLGGALRLVSGVLGTPAPPPPHPASSPRRANSQPPSPQTHEPPPNPLRYFGRELPKAYQVLQDAGYDISSPPEYSPSPAYTHLSPPHPSSPTSSAKTPRSAGFSFFGGGPKRAASPVVDIPEPVNVEEVRDVLRGCKRVVVIGVHGWFPGSMIRTVLGEPTGTSSKFANMMALALHQFELEMDVKFEKVTKVVLEGEGEVKRRVDKLYSTILAHPTHLNDIHRADAILVATHSQGSVVSTHILNKLIQDGHIVTRSSLAERMLGDHRDASETGGDERQGEVFGVGGEVYPGSITGLPSSSSSSTTPASTASTEGLPASSTAVEPLSAPSTSTLSAFDHSTPRKPQRVCCLAMCGIHLGPLRYLRNSGFVGPYLQYLESHAARELFEFQNTESAVSKAYVKALEGVLDAGVKMVYVASLNDQVVPIYSGLFTAVHHPSILRALYIDGDAYSTSDFLCALIVLLIRIINAGLPDSGLIAHLSEATAGSLSGVGHSTAYEEIATYVLAVKYLFLVDEGAMANVHAGPIDGTTPFSSPIPTPASPFFLSPTFSAFSPHLHPHSHSPHSFPFSSSSSSHSLSPLPKPHMTFTPFSAHMETNDYEIPWSLRDLIAHPVISYLFHREIEELRDKFGEWNPKTGVLRDVKRKVSPIARLGSVRMGVGGVDGFGFGFGMRGAVGGGSKL